MDIMVAHHRFLCCLTGYEWSPVPNIVRNGGWVRIILVFCCTDGTPWTQFQSWPKRHALSTFCIVQGTLSLSLGWKKKSVDSDCCASSNVKYKHILLFMFQLVFASLAKYKIVLSWCFAFEQLDLFGVGIIYLSVPLNVYFFIFSLIWSLFLATHDGGTADACMTLNSIKFHSSCSGFFVMPSDFEDFV